MNPELQKIIAIRDSLKSIGIKAEDVYDEIDNLKSRESIFNRYKHIFNAPKKYNNEVQKKYYEIRNPKNIIQRNFHFFIKDDSVIKDLENIFGDDLVPISSNCFAINYSKTKRFFFKTKDIIDKLSFKLNYFNRLKWTESNIMLALKFNIITWKIICEGNFVDWNFDFVEKYKDFLDWNAIKLNKILDWDEYTIEKYSNYLFTEFYLEENESKNYFESLPNVQWTEKLLDKYANHLDFDILFNRSVLRLSEDFIMKYHHRLNFNNLAFYDNVLIYSDTLIQKFNQFIPFYEISKNGNLDISIETYKKFKEKFDFEGLCNNSKIELSIEFIEEFKDVLNWEYVILFKHIQWNLDLVSKYQEYIFRPITELISEVHYSNSLFQFRQKLNHSGYFESNLNVDWSEELIDKFIDKWNWKYLYINTKTRAIITINPKYKDYIKNEYIVEFSDNIDEIERYSHIDNYLVYIGKNYNIVWTPYLFDKYIINSKVIYIDTFCLNAKIENETIIQYQEYWNKLIAKQEYYRRNSDGSYFDTNYDYLWYFLFKNKNITWDDELIVGCIENIKFHLFFWIKNLQLSIDTINTYFDYSKEEKVYSRGDYDSGSRCELQLLIFKDIVNSCLDDLIIKDLTFEKFQKFELKWFDSSLIEYNFNSVKLNKTIRELLEKEFNIEYTKAC